MSRQVQHNFIKKTNGESANVLDPAGIQNVINQAHHTKMHDGFVHIQCGDSQPVELYSKKTCRPLLHH